MEEQPEKNWVKYDGRSLREMVVKHGGRYSEIANVSISEHLVNFLVSSVVEAETKFTVGD